VEAEDLRLYLRVLIQDAEGIFGYKEVLLQ
jgi:hypothetical protein